MLNCYQQHTSYSYVYLIKVIKDSTPKTLKVDLVDCVQQVFFSSFDHSDNLDALEINVSNMIH